MKIIIYENSMKSDNISDIKNEYINRINRYCNIKILKNKNFTQSNKEYIININKNSKTISSIEFAEKISDILSKGCSCISFIRNDCLPTAYDFELSLTDIEVSYEMQGIILLEQIYRAFKINNNEVYHK